MDNLFVIRQFQDDIKEKGIHLFQPDPTSLLPNSRRVGNFEGKNPNREVPLYYYLKDNQSNHELTIEIYDSSGDKVKYFSSKESAHDRCIIGNMDPRSPFEINYPKSSIGLNAWHWNMHSENMQCVEDIALFSGFEGPRVKPGNYKAVIKVGNLVDSINFTIQPDPRINSNESEVNDWADQLAITKETLNTILKETKSIRNTKQEIQSAAFERLLQHLRERKDVQNIDLMNLAGFCRNCLSKWYREEAKKKGIEISDPEARKHVYGMPYAEWKEKHQK